MQVYGAKCKFDLPKHKGDGDAAVTVGTKEQGVSGVVNGKTMVTPIKLAIMHNSKGLPIRPATICLDLSIA